MSKKGRRGNPRIKELGIKTRFRPGVSGNPGGRSKTRVLAEMLSAIGGEIEPKSGKTWFQLAAEALVSKAFRGDAQAFREFADRVDGRTTQNVELTGGLQVQHGQSEWMARYEKATPEERAQMKQQLDDEILASAERIRLERVDTPENRYRNWMREYSSRVAAGENPDDVRATMKSPPVN